MNLRVELNLLSSHELIYIRGVLRHAHRQSIRFSDAIGVICRNQRAPSRHVLDHRFSGLPGIYFGIYRLNRRAQRS